MPVCVCTYIYIYIYTIIYIQTYHVKVMSSVTASRCPCHRINKLLACKPQRLATLFDMVWQRQMKHFSATLPCYTSYGKQSVFTLGERELLYFWENGPKDFTRKSSQSKWVRTEDIHILSPTVFNETAWLNFVPVSPRQLPGYQVWVSPVDAETTVRILTRTAQNTRNTHKSKALRKHLVRIAISCSRALCNFD